MACTLWLLRWLVFLSFGSDHQIVVHSWISSEKKVSAEMVDGRRLIKSDVDWSVQLVYKYFLVFSPLFNSVFWSFRFYFLSFSESREKLRNIGIGSVPRTERVGLHISVVIWPLFEGKERCRMVGWTSQKSSRALKVMTFQSRVSGET